MITMAIAVGLMAAASGYQAYSGMEAQRKQAEYQAAVARNNAVLGQQQADLERRKTEIAQRGIDEEKKRVKREYSSAAGENRSILAAGNLDITSGSALDLLEGNYNRFADDMGEMEYQKALTGWEGERQAQLHEYGASSGLSQASFLESTAGSVGQSVLTGGLSAGKELAGAYVATGGFKGAKGKK